MAYTFQKYEDPDSSFNAFVVSEDLGPEPFTLPLNFVFCTWIQYSAKALKALFNIDISEGTLARNSEEFADHEDPHEIGGKLFLFITNESNAISSIAWMSTLRRFLPPDCYDQLEAFCYEQFT